MTMDVLSLYFLTWNVVTLDPPSLHQLKSLFEKQADFIAVGLQEVRSQPHNIITDAINEDPWTNSIRDVLAQRNYVKIHTIRLLGILLSFYSKKTHLTSIRNIETSYTRRGMSGYWGNKGAVSIRFNYKGNSVCLVNCHLSPHDNMVTRRVADYQGIITSQTFQKEKISSILDHDLVFWFGDLNFRLEQDSFSTKEIVNHVAKNDLKPLLERDELNKCISSRAAFDGFSECKINFKPTYKFLINSQQYDEKRRPAWTDRILYRKFDEDQQQQSSVNENNQVKCKSYESFSNLTMSDHKPVAAHFDVRVKGGEMDVVSFDPVKSFAAGTSSTIVYTLPATIEPSSWHWIAFFREDFSSLGEYVSYVWGSTQPLSAAGRPRTYEITVPETSIRLPGKYQAAYMSDTAPYHVMGLSSSFEVDEAHSKEKEL